MDVIRSGGINWDMFFSFKDLGNGKAEVKALDRYHRFDGDGPPKSFKIIGDISMFCDSLRRSGVDITKYKATKVIEHYKKTHVLLTDGRLFEMAE